ncbi:hypothetical protein LP7551_03873 [Roseibium album]|nr:hypothetical protein LP7551_03873 [Roseibium album]
MHLIRRLVALALYIAVLLSMFWACAALWIDGPTSRPLSGFLAVGYAAVTVLILLRCQPITRSVTLYLAPFAAVLWWWLSIAPSNDRDWQAEVARLASARIEGDMVTIENVRDFDYSSETDITERWETRSYKLSEIKGVDLFKSHWGSPLIAHTFISWEFEQGPPLTISIETRKEVGEVYSAVRGFFRQFELYYVVSSEADLAKVRTNVRGETVYLYRLRGTPEEARALLLDYLKTVNELREKPAWYNALEYNCTTSIRQHIQAIVPVPFDWRILVNGYLDEAAYEHGNINTSIPFDELREASRINERANADGTESYSVRIRTGLPARPGVD